MRSGGEGEFHLIRVSRDEMVLGKPGVDVTGILQAVVSRLWGDAHPLTKAAIGRMLDGNAASFLTEGIEVPRSAQHARRELLNYDRLNLE